MKDGFSSSYVTGSTECLIINSLFAMVSSRAQRRDDFAFMSERSRRELRSAKRVDADEEFEEECVAVLEKLKAKLAARRLFRLHAEAGDALKPLCETIRMLRTRVEESIGLEDDDLEEALNEFNDTVDALEVTFVDDPFFPDEDYSWVEDALEVVRQDSPLFIAPECTEEIVDALTEFLSAIKAR